ncbi:MAG: DnaJ domain-containing protein [Halorhabdus sp.]
MPSPADVLGVDPGADRETLRQAYRRRAKDAHPDQGGSIAEFRAIQSAYETLRDGDSSDYGSSSPTVGSTTEVEFVDYEVLEDEGWSLDDPNLLRRVRAADLDGNEYGEATVGRDEPLLQSVEQRGYTWPYSCRGGACANCAVAVLEGELAQPVNHVLPEDAVDRGIRLSCVGWPTTATLTVVYNVKHLPSIADLQLPPRPADRRSRK